MGLFIGGPIFFEIYKRLKIGLYQKRICNPLMTDSRFRQNAVIVSGEYAGLVRQGQELLVQGMIFGFGLRPQIGAADFSDEQRIAGEYRIANVQADRVLGMAGSVNNPNRQFTKRKYRAIGQSDAAVRFDVAKEQRPYAGQLFDFRIPIGMIVMSVGGENIANCESMLTGEIDNNARRVRWIDNNGFFCGVMSIGVVSRQIPVIPVTAGQKLMYEHGV